MNSDIKIVEKQIEELARKYANSEDKVDPQEVVEDLTTILEDVAKKEKIVPL